MLTQTALQHDAYAGDLSSYAWRPHRREDVPALYQLLMAVDRADDRGLITTLEDMRHQFDDPRSNPETDSLLAHTQQGQVAAMGRVFANPHPEAECRAYLQGEIHPEHRGRGLEEFVFAWLEARGRERLNELPAHLPRVLRMSVQDNLHGHMAMLERRGFKPVRYAYRMRRDLSQPIPEQTAPYGVTLRAYSRELDRGMLEAFNESFADHWGFEPITDQEWRMFLTGRSDFRPDLTFLAMQDDQVVGFSLNAVNTESNERQGVREGWIQDLGVRRPWRKRGIASALLCQSMRAFKSAALDYATLGVDAENLTGALRLYERLGFVAVKRFVTFEKAIASA